MDKLDIEAKMGIHICRLYAEDIAKASIQLSEEEAEAYTKELEEVRRIVMGCTEVEYL